METSAPPEARGRVAGLRSAALTAVGRAATLWRRSVQARVVISVLALSGLAAGFVGWALLGQITTGLVQGRVHASLAEAATETSVADDRLRQASSSDFDPASQMRQLVESLVERGNVRGFSVVVIGPVNGSAAGQGSGVGTRTSPQVSAVSVPESLQTAVQHRDRTAWTYTRIHYLPGTGRHDVAGVAVGSQILLPADGGTYGLYLLFPMSQEQQTLSLLRQALLISGVLLLVLVAGLTALVTRQVVAPVQLVRRVAERIASGRLEERMQVRGEDDIARLATSFNQMTDALQSQIRRLEDLSRLQRQFVSDVSHELRTPLTTVRMASDVLHDERARFDPVTARAAELLQRELDRFEVLLGDLLEISRFDAGAASLELDDVDLTEVTRRVIEATAPLAERRGVRVVLETQEPVVAEADVRRVQRIVRNLVTNAIDHADGPLGRLVVRLRLAASDDVTALTVRDYGPGLAPGQSAMVFNRFWRADPARARTSGGTGLGLSIALEDARLHGGRLQAWGRLGEGAQFRLTLPRHAGDQVGHSPLPLVPEDLADDLPGDGLVDVPGPDREHPVPRPSRGARS